MLVTLKIFGELFFCFLGMLEERYAVQDYYLFQRISSAFTFNEVRIELSTELLIYSLGIILGTTVKLRPFDRRDV